jgi:dTDP-4-amino-4,6-dideoxy-D-galactose acyltransferase
MISPPSIAARTGASASQTGAREICTYLDWDSNFFGQRIARLNGSRLTGSNVTDVLAWCADQRIDCLYLLGDADDAETGRVAEQNSFLEVDVRLTLARPITQEDQPSGLPMDCRVRLAHESDLTILRQLVRTLHHESRFYFDQGFERAKCDLLYETWIEKSFEDPAQTVFVPEVDGQPVGYMACNAAGHESQIGLLGIAGSHARTGLGKALVQRFLLWSAQQGIRRATVVTQARNTAAQGLYQHCGFLPLFSQRWYHRWFTDRE